jgi:hypothetical protein
MSDVGRISVLEALDTALGVKRITDLASDLRGDDVPQPEPVEPELSVLVHRDGVAMLPSDAAVELEQYMAGIPGHSIDGAVIHSDILCNLRGWR